MGLGKPQVRAELEVAIFSRCRNIKETPKILGSFLAQGHTHPLFLLGAIL